MMKTADSSQGQRLARFDRAWLNRSAGRRRLLQAEVRSVFVVVGDVFTPKSPEVLIVQRDYVIEHFAASTADPGSAPPFCQGLRTLVRVGFMAVARRNSKTSPPNLASRSNRTYR